MGDPRRSRRRGPSEPVALGDALAGVSRRLGGAPLVATAAIFSRWEEIVGSDVASHVRPLVVRGGVLHLEADHPGWATQMGFLEADLLRRLAETVGPGVVEAVQVRIRRNHPRP